MSRTVRRHRIIALIAAFAMVTVICGFSAQGLTAHAHDSDHCDWALHFTGVAGSAPKPAPVGRPVRAAWAPPSPTPAAPRNARRLRAHLARGPPARLLPALIAA